VHSSLSAPSATTSTGTLYFVALGIIAKEMSSYIADASNNLRDFKLAVEYKYLVIYIFIDQCCIHC
jgi:hypothetical protein